MMPFDSDPAMQARYETFMNYVSEALHAGQDRMDRMEGNITANTEAIEKNTAATEAHQAQTKEMIEAFNAMKGGMKVLETIGKLGKIIGGIAVGYAALRAVAHADWNSLLKLFK